MVTVGMVPGSPIIVTKETKEQGKLTFVILESIDSFWLNAFTFRVIDSRFHQTEDVSFTLIHV